MSQTEKKINTHGEVSLETCNADSDNSCDTLRVSDSAGEQNNFKGKCRNKRMTLMNKIWITRIRGNG